MDWQRIIFTIVSAVVTALASFVVAKVSTLINTKVKDSKARGYLNAALTLVSAVVKATYQTYVESIKGTNAWTAEAQKIALNNALETAKHQLSDELKDYIQNNFGDVDQWLINQIESTLYDLKNKLKEADNVGN